LKNYTPDGILSWRESVGDDVADHVMRTATTRGNKVHKLIENCLSNKPETDLVGNHGVLAAGLFQLMIPSLDKIDQIRVLEKAIYSKRLRLAGTVDCIAEYDGKLSIIDFKTASRKRDEINENYLVQATFYSIAWEERTGEKIDQIVILTVTEDGALDVHKDDPSLYVKKLEEMIEEYKTGKIGDR
jgi:genome maintenance exonuclease 1